MLRIDEDADGQVIAMPNFDVPFLPDADIETHAARLLADCGQAGLTIQLPVPVEPILESHLGLHLEFDDLCSRLKLPDVLGALYLDSGEVAIDTSLDPGERPERLGRFRFTLAHEVGHWQLHRTHVLAHRQQSDLFGNTSTSSIVCRTSQAKAHIEVQADRFAAALLMPPGDVRQHWNRLMGPERLTRSELCSRGKAYIATAPPSRVRPSLDPIDQENDLIERVIRPMAETFEVSPQAMRIRLRELGLIVRDAEATMSLFEAI